MDKWVISWISWHDYELHMSYCIADTYEDALKYALRSLVGLWEDLQGWKDYIEGLELNTSEDIKQEAFNCDGMVGAMCTNESV